MLKIFGTIMHSGTDGHNKFSCEKDMTTCVNVLFAGLYHVCRYCQRTSKRHNTYASFY